jgi:hypothetical protein
MPATKRPASNRAKKTPRPSAGAVVEPEGNAVELMLAVASETDSHFDSMFSRLRCDAPHLPSECLSRLLSETVAIVAASPDLAESGLLPYPVTTAQAALMSRWGCYGALHVAVEKTLAEGIARGEHHGSGADLTPQGIVTYAGILGERDSLLDAERWLSMVSDVIADHSSWGYVGARVVERAEALQTAVQRLRSLGPNPPSCEWQAWADLRSAWEEERASLRAAIDALRPYANSWLEEKHGFLLPAIDSLRGLTRPPAAAEPAPADRVDPERSDRKRQWLADAMFLVRDYPEWSDAKIAREVGVHPSTLCRDEEYGRVADMAREPRARPTSGRKDRSGGIEAAERAPGGAGERPAAAKEPPVSVVGQPVSGSKRRLVWERCAVPKCDEMFGVAAADLGTGQVCHECKRLDG